MSIVEGETGRKKMANAEYQRPDISEQGSSQLLLFKSLGSGDSQLCCHPQTRVRANGSSWGNCEEEMEQG